MPYGFKSRLEAEERAEELRNHREGGFLKVMPYEFREDSYTHSYKESDVIKWGVGIYSPYTVNTPFLFEGFYYFD